MSIARNVLRSSTLNLFDHVVRFAAIFLITPLMVESLGQYTYGIWLLLMTVFSYYSLLDLGIGLSSTHFVAKAIGTGDDNVITSVVSTCAVLFRRIGLVALGFTAVALMACPLFFDAPEILRAWRIAFAIYGANVCLRFFLLIYVVILKSHVRYEFIVFSSLVKIVLQTSLLYGFLSRGCGLVTLVVIHVSCQLIDQLLLLIFARKVSGGIRPVAAAYDKDKAREIIRYSIISFLYSTGMNLKNQVGPIVVAVISGVKLVPVFSIGARFMMILTDVINSLFGGQFLAAFSQIEGRSEDDGSLKRAFSHAMKFSVIATLFGVFSVVVYSEAFLQRWVGSAFDDSYRVALILAVPFAAQLAQYPAVNLLYTKGVHAFLARICFASGIANVLLSILLGWWIGFFGIAWATFAEMTIFYLLVLPPVVCRVAEISLFRYCFHILILNSVKTLLPLSIFYLLVRSFIQPDYLRLALIAALQGAVFLPVLWYFLLDREERILIRESVLKNMPLLQRALNL